MFCLRKPQILKGNREENPSVCSLLGPLILLLPPSNQQFPQFPISTWPRVASLAKKSPSKHCTCHQTLHLATLRDFPLGFQPSCPGSSRSTADADSSRQDIFLQKHFFNALHTLVMAQRSLTLVTKPLVKMSLENQPCCCPHHRQGRC